MNMKPSSSDTGGIRLTLAIVYTLIVSLILDPINPRHHSKRQIRQLAESIRTFGFLVPVLIDAAGRVIAGHGRVLAAQLLGLTQVPTIQVEHLSAAQARAFQIADNRLTEISVWDDRLLGEQLKDLSNLHLDFSLEITGFDMAEIDLRIQDIATAAPAEAADALPPPNPIIVTQAGDVWLLGRHRILCGDARDLAAYFALLQGELAAMVITDPPYNVPIVGHASGLGAIQHREFAMAVGEMTETEFMAFLATVCSLLARHSSDGSLHFLFMDWRHIGELLTAGRQIYSELKNICVWVKHNAGMGSLWRSQHEFVVVFKHGQARHRNQVQLGKYGRHRTNVWQYQGPSSFGRSGEEGNLLALHPTVKPVALVADAMIDCSQRGDVVLDVFIGSGTSLIAAERTGRRCYGMEIDPAYVDTAVRRWQAFTGETARHAVTGRSFADCESDAGERHGR